MNWRMKFQGGVASAALALAMSFLALVGAASAGAGDTPLVVAQAMIPPSGMDDAAKPMPMNERYLRRFPQPARVGDLIGLPVIDDDASTIGFVRQVVRTGDGKIEFIVSYSRWFGWFGRPVAAPLEVFGILGRELASLDMPPSEYAAAPTWHGDNATVLPPDATIKVALGRR